MRRSVEGEMLNVYYNVGSNDASSKLLPAPPRAVYAGEIYELFVTDDEAAKPGGIVRRHRILGHFEVKRSGLIRTGDLVSVMGKDVGTVVGYEACKVLRAPERAVMHVFAKAGKMKGSKELGIKLGGRVVFTPVDKELT